MSSLEATSATQAKVSYLKRIKTLLSLIYLFQAPEAVEEKSATQIEAAPVAAAVTKKETDNGKNNFRVTRSFSNNLFRRTICCCQYR